MKTGGHDEAWRNGQESAMPHRSRRDRQILLVAEAEAHLVALACGKLIQVFRRNDQAVVLAKLGECDLLRDKSKLETVRP